MSTVAGGVARGEYSLLLGAGASMGAIGGNGIELPSGPGLRSRLLQEFQITSEEDEITLSRAYAAAKRRHPRRLARLLRHWFTGCSPSWQGLFAEFKWHRIWTLNIDDVVENAYGNASLQLDSFDWTSRHRDSHYSEHQIIHLHSYAGNIVDVPSCDASLGMDHLVFSVDEYASTAADARTWHAVFADEFVDRPFIILGASLYEELDLQQAMRRETKAEEVTGLPSIIVLRQVTDLQREELSDLGLMVVESDAQTFMETLHGEVETSKRALGSGYGQVFCPEIARFLQQFIDLRSYQPHLPSARHEFYAGYEPHWGNVLEDDDARMDTTEAVLDALVAESKRAGIRQGIHIVSGRQGTGKSTGILRIARDLMARGLLPLAFRGEEKLDVEAALYWLKKVGGTVLLFDNCADYAQSLNELALECEKEKVRLLVVGAERSSHCGKLEDAIPPKFLNLDAAYRYRRLSDRDIDSLIGKLESRRRLGRITRRTTKDRRRYFRVTASRLLFEAMADLEGGPGFRERLRSGYQGIEDGGFKEIYAASSIAYQMGFALSLGIAARVGQLPVGRLHHLIANTDILVVTPDGVRPPHRITASIIVDSALSAEDKFTAVYRLMETLAPHVDVNAIRRYTRHHRLLRRLMDEEAVIRLVGSQRGRELYDAVQPLFDWNGRYWEQRALFESRLENHPQARSYAERSLQIHRHPFAFNTLGTILGRMAIEKKDVELLLECVENLEAARDNRTRDISEHPYYTFFYTWIGFGEKWGIGAIPVSLRNRWSHWLRQARVDGVFLHSAGERKLKNLEKQWLLLAT